MIKTGDTGPYRDQLVVLSNLAVDGGITTDFTVNLPRGILVRSLKLNYFSIPSSTYNLGSNLNEPFWTFEEQGFPEVQNAKLPGRYYTSTNIITFLENYLNSISPSGATYTVSFVPGTGRLRVASSGINFRFGGAQGTNLINPFYFQIGFSERTGNIVQPFANNTVLSSAINFLPVYAGFFITVKTAESGFEGKGVLAGSNTSFSFFCPESNVSTSISQFSSNFLFDQSVGNSMASRYINQIQIQVRDFFGRLVSTDGGLSTFVFEYFS